MKDFCLFRIPNKKAGHKPDSVRPEFISGSPYHLSRLSVTRKF